MRAKFVGKLAVACCVSVLAAPAAVAAPFITSVASNLATAPYTFSYAGSSFTFGFNGDYFGNGPVTISTSGGGQVNTVLGQPTTNFTDRNTVTFSPGMQYAAFSSQTPIRFTNNNNFIGLRAAAGNGDFFYGFAYTTNNIINSIGFETSVNQAITATVAIPAIPEPATWAMMVGGFGLIGGTMRRRSHAGVRQRAKLAA